MYVPLWCKSNFSFLEGASHPEELVEAAHAAGLTELAITDRDGVYGVVRAHEKARELGMKIIIGSEITVVENLSPQSSLSTLVLLAQNRVGYGHLCQLITVGRRRSKKGDSRVLWSEVMAHADGLLALCGGPQSILSQPHEPENLAVLREAFSDRLYALLVRHAQPEEADAEKRLRARAVDYQLPLVAANEVLYHHKSRKNLQDILTCIRHGMKIDDAGRLIKPNREHDIKSAADFQARFSDFPEIVARTLEVAARCNFSLGELRYRYPVENLPDGKSSFVWLKELALVGVKRRYPDGMPVDVARQLETELVLVDELEYSGYFLTLWEVVQYCARKNILCQGRGSAANSVLCYCLGITAIDPVRMGLLFERFLSRERAEPPDIDLDIEHERREEVIQHVYEKYGRDRAAMVANVIRYRSKSAIRDVGKALGLSETHLDRIAKLFSHHDSLSEENLQAARLDLSENRTRHFFQLIQEIQNFPRHLSIHPGGFLLGHDPIATLVPVENGTMADRTVIQWDKDDVEAMGLFKVDLLGLGALSHMHRCFDLIRQHRQKELSLATIPAGDGATFDRICQADTVGVFQIESRAQMSMLPRLRPRTYYDLVIQISIVRPGPITGGMVHPYLRRRRGEEPVDYAHPLLEPVLKKTLGVPLFQEQVMRLAIVAADYTPGEADQLRRDMAAWRHDGRIEKHRDRLITRMQKKGIEPAFAERVFNQIRGFGEYGFPESHAASFALICYAGSYLKHHYPSEFTCALLNSQPMGFYSTSTILEDAKRHDIEIRPLDIVHSRWDFTIEDNGRGGALRMGFRFLHGFSARAYAALDDARRECAFSDLEDFVRRVPLAKNIFSSLASAGAFASIAGSRRETLWTLLGYATTPPLPLAPETETMPTLPPLTKRETIAWDYSEMGHSAHGHPLSTWRSQLTALGLPDARGVHGKRHGTRVDYAGLVICRQRPGTASGVTFFTLEDETGCVNVVVWAQVFEAYRTLARGEPFLGVSGKLQVEEGVVHLVAEKLWTPQFSSSPAELKSRNFH